MHASSLDLAFRIIGHTRLPGVHRLIRHMRPRRPTKFEVPFSGLRYRGSLDEMIDWHIFFFGSYSPQELEALAVTARVKLEKNKSANYYDVGANVGQHALFMSRRITNVIAFEPAQAARAQFKQNVIINRISNVHIFPFALGDKEEVGVLGSGFPGNSGSRSLTWTLDQSQEVESVPIRNGDALITELQLPRMDILKVDVEGYEKRVLQGLRKTLLKDRPIILMELIGQSEKGGFTRPEELFDCLYPEGELFSLARSKKAKLIPFSWDEEEMVFLPREDVDAFRKMARGNC